MYWNETTPRGPASYLCEPVRVLVLILRSLSLFRVDSFSVLASCSL